MMVVMQNKFILPYADQVRTVPVLPLSVMRTANAPHYSLSPMKIKYEQAQSGVGMLPCGRAVRIRL